ncbi:hypothetical protein GSI_08790 [Ganoderma sinense ZZ0214-1]|uniref:Uncharacterized protein n=1 Tax=Ganoderma sinense ZZ0214-1 TaxID=1077348 RepID=A0A2G8S4P2_9APHY|nr:hypothetical protein GSI_08790 [Ganoderma sinense ZZ0214-1]
MVESSALEDDLSGGAPLFAQLFSAQWELFVCNCCMEVQWSVDPDDEVFYGLDFETETDLSCFIQAFDNAKTLAASSTKVEGSILSKPLDHEEVLRLLAKKSREIFSESNDLATTDASTLLHTLTQWLLDAWRRLW